MTADLCTKCKTNRRANSTRGYCSPCNREYDREYRKRTRAYYFKRFRLMGITEAHYEQMLEAQGARCAICRSVDPGGRSTWHIDHDHRCCDTGGRACGACVRGLLCPKCNRALGGFNDSPKLLRSAADYLENASARQPQ